MMVSKDFLALPKWDNELEHLKEEPPKHQQSTFHVCSGKNHFGEGGHYPGILCYT